MTGLANAGFSIMQATLVYLSAPPEMRSRIFGVLSVCIGVGMIGFIHLGLLAGLIGASWATAAIGVEGLLVHAADAALVARDRGVRRCDGGLRGNRRSAPQQPMYGEARLQEKKMSTASLDLRRAETRGIDYVERARQLAPLLIDAADEIEEQRQLPERVVEALIEGGFFRLLLPRSLGGAELHPLTYVQVLEEIAKAEPSAAWSLGQNSGCSMSAPYLDPAVAREVFGPRARHPRLGAGPAGRRAAASPSKAASG